MTLPIFCMKMTSLLYVESMQNHEMYWLSYWNLLVAAIDNILSSWNIG